VNLLNYTGLFGEWPPPAYNPRGEIVNLDHCRDTLIVAFEPTRNDPGLIRILTAFDNLLFMRELPGQEKFFAHTLCRFLNRNSRKTILGIGQIEIPFLP
jgi:hypothetical protein